MHWHMKNPLSHIKNANQVIILFNIILEKKCINIINE